MAVTPTNNPVTNYFKTSYLELKKVTWPSREDALRHSAIVIAVSLTVAVFFGVLDWILSLGLEQLLNAVN